MNTQLLIDCINELCLYCGKYKNEHEGACEGCKWLSTNDVYMSMAEDIKTNCEFSECISYEEDDFGKMWLDYVCPFYDANDERCRIGEPSTWDI